jgi:propionate CoA-transferase
MSTKITDAQTAVRLVTAGDTIFVDGSGGGVNQPDALLSALAERFDSSPDVYDLTIVHPSGLGDGLGGGVDRLATPGLVKRVIAGHWGWTPKMQTLARAEEIEAYCLPQGVISHLMRETAAGRPGVVTKVGLGTACDPRLQGGRLNNSAKEDLVEIVQLSGQEWLLYKSFPVNVTIIKGSYADERGNLCMDHEGLAAEVLSAAQAARNSGGIVLAQVPYAVEAYSIDPRRVKVPGILVDAVAVAPDTQLSAATAADPTLTGEARAPITVRPRASLNERTVIARRAAGELHSGDVVNLGFGMPDGVATTLADDGLIDQVTLTVEQGHVGGIPAGGTDFGLARNAEATIDAGYQFDFYDGGGLNTAVLSFAQVDAVGNVNVSRFGTRMPGVGGFINISHGARRVVFVGTLTTAKQGYAFSPSQVTVPAGAAKFVAEVEQVSFSARAALERGQTVLYVTERAVFELGADGPVLTEIAPGLDLSDNVLAHLGFRPEIAPNLRRIDPRVFDDSDTTYLAERLAREKTPTVGSEGRTQ